jgi:superfamily II DNA or RNA helicase
MNINLSKNNINNNNNLKIKKLDKFKETKKIKVALTKKGYLLPAKYLNGDELINIKNQLTFIPLVNENFTSRISKPTEISLLRYFENNNNNNLIIIPRFFKIINFEYEIVKNSLNENIKQIKINFKGKLKENQDKVINNTYKKLLNSYNMLYCLPCGFGKTVIAIYILCKLKLKTFILVHKCELMDQWIDRLLFFTDISKEEIGIIGDSKKIVNDKCKIIIGMEQTLMMDFFDKSIIPEDIGLLICDECHHLGAEKFNKSIQKIYSKYFVSLSATPYRNDGMTDVYKSFLGYNEYKQERGKTDTVIVRKLEYKMSEEKIKKYNFIFSNTKKLQNTINILVKDDDRNLLILELIYDCINNNRKILLLSDRIKQLELYYDNSLKYIKNKNVKISRLFSNYSEDLKNCDILLATFSKAAEGLDVPQLNTLILATPKSNVEQSCGRILRKCCGIERYIFDITDVNVDNINYFYYNRYRFYKKSKFIITKSNNKNNENNFCTKTYDIDNDFILNDENFEDLNNENINIEEKNKQIIINNDNNFFKDLE